MTLRKSSRQVALVAGLVLAVGALAAHFATAKSTSRMASPVQDRPWPSQIPRATFGGTNGTLRHAFQAGRARVDTARRSVSLEWWAGSHVNTDNVNTPLPGAPLLASQSWMETASQPFSTRYYPLQASVLDSDRIVLAGVDDLAQPVLEVWSLTWPAQMPAPQAVPGDTTPKAVSVVLPQRSVRRIPNGASASPERVHVFGMCPISRDGGPDTRVLLNYYESWDHFYSVALDSGAHVLVASASNGGAIGSVPAVGQQYYQSLSVMRHPEEGYVYSLQGGFRSGGHLEDLPDVVIFLDENYDGQIDAHQVVSAVQYYAPNGWGDVRQYPAWWWR